MLDVCVAEEEGGKKNRTKKATLMVLDWAAATADAELARDEAVTEGVNTAYLLPHNTHCIALPMITRELLEIAPVEE